MILFYYLIVMSDLAIGDISGYKKTFDKLIKQSPHSRIIALGDIIDRGPESRQMIEFFIQNPQHITLMGNHEHMFIKTYEQVVENKKSPYYSSIWIYANGGKETLESYGIFVPECPYSRRELLDLRTHERAEFIETPPMKKMFSEFSKIPKTHIDFLKGLPLFVETDKAFFSHAPIKNWNNPKLFQYAEFDVNELLLDIGCLWGRLDPDKPRIDKKMIIYGHQNKSKVLAHSKKYPSGLYVNELWQNIPTDSWGACIDTAKSGYLTALNMSDLSLHYELIKEE
jgi:hypothetical protein